MLNRFRHSAPPLVRLICLALLAMWLSGAHGHRHLATHGHEHMVAAAGHLDLHAADHAQSGPGPEIFAAHSPAMIHADGHENIELKALQAPAGAQPGDPLALALLVCAVALVTRSRPHRAVVVNDPPISRSRCQSLRPPLRGPPASAS